VIKIIVDLSFPLKPNMPVYPGDPEVKFIKRSSIDKQNVNLSEIKIGTHSGTHLDAPSHYIINGRTVDKIDLNRCWGKAVVIKCKKKF
jgi:kynurenine formamidase